MNVRSSILALAVIALVSGCGSSSDSVNVDPSFDTTPPMTPGNISTNYDNMLRRTSITWQPSASPDVAGYQIYAYDPDPSRESAYSLLSESTDTSCDLPYVASNTTMHVRIRAVDSAGNQSAFTSVTPVINRGSTFDLP